MRRPLRIGVSARIFHPEPGATGLRSKNLQYLEESIAQWVMSRDVLVFMIPTVNTDGLLHPSNIRLRDYARHLDGLVLQGGADVSPQSYSETADPARSGAATGPRHVRARAAARVRRRRQAGAGHLPRLPADQRRLRRHAVPGHRLGPAGRAPRTSTTPTTATATHRLPAGLLARRLFPNRPTAWSNRSTTRPSSTLGRDMGSRRYPCPTSDRGDPLPRPPS